jgi:hypothetical protein
MTFLFATGGRGSRNRQEDYLPLDFSQFHIMGWYEFTTDSYKYRRTTTGLEKSIDFT